VDDLFLYTDETLDSLRAAVDKAEKIFALAREPREALTAANKRDMKAWAVGDNALDEVKAL
jgi:hypothetical protein